MASVDKSSEPTNLDDMKTDDATPSCLNDPNYAIICVFLQKFGGQLKIEHPDFLRLQKMIENTDEGKATQYNNNNNSSNSGSSSTKCYTLLVGVALAIRVICYAYIHKHIRCVCAECVMLEWQAYAFFEWFLLCWCTCVRVCGCVFICRRFPKCECLFQCGWANVKIDFVVYMHDVASYNFSTHTSNTKYQLSPFGILTQSTECHSFNCICWCFYNTKKNLL